MKKIIFLGLIVFVTIGSCTQEKKSPLEGTWRCIYMRPQQLADTSFQAMIKNGQIKTFSKTYFTFVGHFEDGTSTHESYGAGTYTLNGNKYEERIIYHNVKSLIGKRYKALDEIRNDTLFHYQLHEGANEIYVRLK
jgi:hypothetical protein